MLQKGKDVVDVDEIEDEMLDIILETVREKRDWRAAVRWLEIHNLERYRSTKSRGGRPLGRALHAGRADGVGGRRGQDDRHGR
jgi:hypothetical protein